MPSTGEEGRVRCRKRQLPPPGNLLSQENLCPSHQHLALCFQKVQQPFYFWHFSVFITSSLALKALVEQCSVQAFVLVHPVPGAALTRPHSARRAGDRDGDTSSSAVAAAWHRVGCSAQGQSLSCCSLGELCSLHHRDLHREHKVPTLFFAYFVGSRYSSCRHTSWMNTIFFFILNKTNATFCRPFLPLSLPDGFS